jgi:hypothetical protein
MLLIHSLLDEFTSRNRHGIFWCFPRKLVEIDVKAVAMMNNARIADPVWPDPAIAPQSRKARQRLSSGYCEAADIKAKRVTP